MSASKYNMKEELTILLGIFWLLSVFLIPASACNVDNFCQINDADNITITVFNVTNGNIIESADVFIDIWRGSSQITSQSAFTEQGNGIYYYELSENEINTTGKYRYSINVTKDSYGFIQSGNYQIVNNLPTEQLTEMNLTTYNINSLMIDSSSSLYGNIWNYATRTLTSAVSVDYDMIAQYVWNFTSRVLSSAGVDNIAQQTWNSTVVGTRTVDETPHQGWYMDRYGNLVYGTIPAGAS